MLRVCIEYDGYCRHEEDQFQKEDMEEEDEMANFIVVVDEVEANDLCRGENVNKIEDCLAI